MKVHNFCRSCNQDFGSVNAFDMHRVGNHEYTYSEGLKQDPPIEDGRRCLTVHELERVTDRKGELMFTQRTPGLWSLTASVKGGERMRAKQGL